MKKALIILTLALIATWLVVLPGLVGLYLDRWLPEWLASQGLSEASESRAGWFRSGLELAHPELDLQARARHLPPTAGAWLQVDGELKPAWLEAPLTIDGRFGLFGNTRLTLAGPSLSTDSEPALKAGPGRLQLAQSSPDRIEARLDLGSLAIEDRQGNRLATGDAELALDWQRLDETHAALALDLRLPERQAALSLDIGPIAMQPLSELAQGLEQLRRARPDTIDQQLAALTIAGAWQQLAEAGLEISLNELRLDNETALVGRWKAAGPMPLLRGGGRTETLLDWLASIIGLSRRISPEMAEREARSWLTSLADRQWLAPEGEHFEFHFPAAPLSEY
jgi:hypothetical protein